GAGSKQPLHIQMLFDPTEKQLDLPALLINRGNGFGGQENQVGCNANEIPFAVEKGDHPEPPLCLLGFASENGRHILNHVGVVNRPSTKRLRIGKHLPLQERSIYFLAPESDGAVFRLHSNIVVSSLRWRNDLSLSE